MSAILYPTTNPNFSEQLLLEKGEGVYVYDKDGKQYLEGMAGLWCVSLGYGNLELAEAAREQITKLSYSHMFGGKYHQVGVDLAEKLKSMVPMDEAAVFFGSSGSDANDTHIKLLHYYFNALGKPQKRKIICRDKGYHGVTYGSAALTGLATSHTNFDPPFKDLGILRVDAPHFYRNGLKGESESDFSTRLANQLEQTIIEAGADTVAAFVAEPMQAVGGVIVPPDDYWQKITAVLHKYDILLCTDEVVTAFGRTGADFGCNTFAIRPQQMTLAKGLSSGYMPISAAVICGDMHEVILEKSSELGVFGHGYTYSGHPVACAVALKALEIYERDNMFEAAAAKGNYLQSRLAELREHPLVGEVRGKGLLAAVELVSNKANRTACLPAMTMFAQQKCQENGLIVRAIAGNCLGICPPLIISLEEIDELVEKLTLSLDQSYYQQARN
ncbi:MAG: aminotransferase class III-fold pyridoxal phosphate-dependent enzyme [Porticoccaceae bacterium]|jgi:4-aminobutyrate---pyruvate transaminase|nr:aminotransferase class III-fold pyridoxal phosphate-dependent enzyme [Porticoccaceae bacterium]